MRAAVSLIDTGAMAARGNADGRAAPIGDPPFDRRPISTRIAHTDGAAPLLPSLEEYRMAALPVARSFLRNAFHQL